MSNSNFSRVFNLPPEDIIEYFKSKGLKTSFDWHEVYADAHARAFTVAKMTDIELLSDTKKLLENALKEGKSYSSFKKEAQELFNKKGWTGFQEVENPKTGEKQTVELGTPSRIKKIYDCNMRSAYAVGRYHEQLEEMDVAPYWQYVAILDKHTRPEHRALNNKVFRADDPFWQNFYPPNGWNCRCYVRNLTKGQVIKEGLKVESTTGKISSVIKKVGDEEKEIPSYTFDNNGNPLTLIPDAGWEGNVGKSYYFEDILAGKLEQMPDVVQDMFIDELAKKIDKSPLYVKKLYERTLPLKDARLLGLRLSVFKLVQEYTNNSTGFNLPVLRKLNGGKVSKQKAENIKKFDNVFEKAATKEVYTVYRGEGAGILRQLPDFENLKNLMIKPENSKEVKNVVERLYGEKITQDLFMSTSFKAKKAQEYAINSKEPKILWTLTVPKGSKALDLRNISSKKYEHELLFKRGQKMRIKKVNYDKENKIWLIEAIIL